MKRVSILSIFLLFYISSYAQKPCPGVPTVKYAGKTYHTVQIGSRCWLKKNLDVGTRINVTVEQTNNGTIEKYCYEDDPANCMIIYIAILFYGTVVCLLNRTIEKYC